MSFHRARMVVIAAAIIPSAATPAVGDTAKQFEFHAYARGGLALNGEGGYQQVFQLNGSDRAYRLGNKDDFYLELAYVHQWLDAATGGVDLGTRFMISYWGHNVGSDPFDGEPIHFREGYAWVGKVAEAMPELRFWAGQRYYGREYIPMLDLFYSSAEGVGGGVENINVGIGKLAVAYLGATKKVIEMGGMEFEEYERGRMVKSSIDMRLYDVAVPLGKAKFWANLAMVPGGRLEAADRDFDDMWGALVGAQWTMSLPSMGGDNHLGTVYKRGVNNFREFPDSAFLNNGDAGFGDYVNIDEFRSDSWRLLVSDWFAVQPLPKLSVLGTALFRVLDPGPADAMNYWWSAGLQPMYYYGKRFGLGIEGSFDYVIDEALNASGHLAKFTVVQKVLASPHWYANPSIQFFATYAQWDRDLGLAWSWSSHGHGVSYMEPSAQDSHGISAGAMFESYF
jgi:maltoporin